MAGFILLLLFLVSLVLAFAYDYRWHAVRGYEKQAGKFLAYTLVLAVIVVAMVIVAITYPNLSGT